MNQLSDQLANPNVTPERQATLDAQILSRIASEVAKLREQEEDVLQQIGNALEKENIDREQALAGADSASLRHDLDTIQERVKSFQGRQRIPKQFPEVNSAREALVACYKSVSLRLGRGVSRSWFAGRMSTPNSTAQNRSQISRLPLPN